MLPSIEEAWSLPIPAELTSRQGALNTAQQVRPAQLDGPVDIHLPLPTPFMRILVFSSYLFNMLLTLYKCAFLQKALDVSYDYKYIYKYLFYTLNTFSVCT